MKNLIHKIPQIISAIIISCIAVYGIVYAQQVCCNAITDACTPTSNRISISYNINTSCRVSPSHSLSYQLQSNHCFSNNLTNFGSSNTCCEADRCDGFNQAVGFSVSSTQDICPFQDNAASFDAGNGERATFQRNNLSKPHNAVPIYILTKSIIC